MLSRPLDSGGNHGDRGRWENTYHTRGEEAAARRTTNLNLLLLVTSSRQSKKEAAVGNLFINAVVKASFFLDQHWLIRGIQLTGAPPVVRRAAGSRQAGGETLVAGILLVACQEQQERNFQSSLRYKKRRRRRRQPYRSALGRRRMHHHSPLPPQPIGAAQEGFVGCVFFLCGSGRRVLALSGEEGTSAVWWRGRCHDGWCVGLRRERRPAFRLCVGVVCVEKRIFVMWARCVGCARWLKSQEPFACKDYSPFWNRKPQSTWRRFCCPVSPSSTPTALRRPSALLTPGVRRAEARGVTKLNVHDT